MPTLGKALLPQQERDILLFSVVVSFLHKRTVSLIFVKGRTWYLSLSNIKNFFFADFMTFKTLVYVNDNFLSIKKI